MQGERGAGAEVLRAELHIYEQNGRNPSKGRELKECEGNCSVSFCEGIILTMIGGVATAVQGKGSLFWTEARNVYSRSWQKPASEELFACKGAFKQAPRRLARRIRQKAPPGNLCISNSDAPSFPQENSLSFIHSFVHSFVHSFSHSFIHSIMGI